MAKQITPPDFIFVKGAREHNLKDFDVSIPRDKLVVITGVSGSGKSSLAFDTIYAEGYRKYIDSLSTKARQVLDQVKRPDVDYIEGLSPVIAIEQRTAGGANPRSTVATVTEVADYARLLWAVCGTPHCPKDGGLVERRSLDECIGQIFERASGCRAMLLAPVLRAKAAIVRDELTRLRQRGFSRVRVDGEVRSFEEGELVPPRSKEVTLEVVVDRVAIDEEQRSRLADSLELAFTEGADQAIVVYQAERGGDWEEFQVSQHFSCVVCGTVYEKPTPRTFSYNHPDGACPTCHGLGQTRQFSEEFLVPDPSLSVKQGAIKPLRLGSKRMIIKRNAVMKQLAEQLPFDATAPWEGLDDEVKRVILHGAGDRMFEFKLTRAKKAPPPQKYEGVMAELESTFAETSSDGLRARLMSYQTSRTCHACGGSRLKAFSMAVTLAERGFAEFMRMPLDEAHTFVEGVMASDPRAGEVPDIFNGLEQRLRFLNEVGLGYLSLDRGYTTLSGGESQRVRLATQLGMGLVGVSYVLDEPSIGLHPRDNRKLLETLVNLRDRGNAVLVVEHDEETMRLADQIIELGPGAGEQGGHLIFQGTVKEAETAKGSLTGAYLSHQLRVEKEAETLPPGGNWLRVLKARENNLKNVDVEFPVGLLTCVTGVSGSGKSTLVNDILADAAAYKLNNAKRIPGKHGGVQGFEYFNRLVRVDQSPIGKSPRSNPASYVKILDLLRALFAEVPLSRVRGYKPSRFSFNVSGGRCEKCKGDGSIKLDMQFLADTFVECPSCHGQRFNRETLDVRFKGFSISEVLDLTVEESLRLFRNQPKIVRKLEALESVGLGYIRLGQPANTLSGGEAQRIKLAFELGKSQQGESLYILDEPTTGLHWADIQKLMDLLFKLRDADNTVIVIEHNLDVVNLADWIVDLGPEGGQAGGEVVYVGPRAGFEDCEGSHTARALREFGAAWV